MLTEQRKQIILDLLEEKTSVTVSELSELLNVSQVTIRKVLNELDEQGYLRRIRGGAFSVNVPIREIPEKEKEKRNIKEKKAIAKKAYKLIEDGEAIFIDAGSTTLELVRLIKDGYKRNITVVTNALNIAIELVEAEDIELIFIGGQVRHSIYSCVGGLAQMAIKSMWFDKVFLGINSISLDNGLTTPNLNEAQVKQFMIQSAKQTIVIVDSTKFEKRSMATICPLEKVDMIITDYRISEKLHKAITDRKVKVEIVTL